MHGGHPSAAFDGLSWLMPFVSAALTTDGASSITALTECLRLALTVALIL